MNIFILIYKIIIGGMLVFAAVNMDTPDLADLSGTGINNNDLKSIKNTVVILVLLAIFL